MTILGIILGATLGTILVLGIIALLIFGSLRNAFRKLGFKVNTIGDMVEEVDKIKREDSKRARSISGMTKLLLPAIRDDFPEFNEHEMYSKTENVLRKVFNSIEKKDVKIIHNLQYLTDTVSRVIEDYEISGIDVKYDDLIFHQFAISKYEKKDGIATVTVAASLEYYYRKTQNNKVLEDFTRYKKQTRYQCHFIYVYNDKLVGESIKSLSINCPNCGAAITSLGHKYCDYCGSAVKEVNLKSWECSSYEEF